MLSGALKLPSKTEAFLPVLPLMAGSSSSWWDLWIWDSSLAERAVPGQGLRFSTLPLTHSVLVRTTAGF